MPALEALNARPDLDDAVVDQTDRLPEVGIIGRAGCSVYRSSPATTSIALEEHAFPAAVATKAGIDPAGLLRPEELDDLGERRLRAMDKAGVDVQVLSVPSAASQELGGQQAIALSRELNDTLANAVNAHRERLWSFASLPMCDPQAAADELVRARTWAVCGRDQYVAEFRTTAAGLLTLRDWLVAHRVEQGRMEAHRRLLQARLGCAAGRVRATTRQCSPR